jgi:intracellular multiplication protein IcmL
MAALLEMREHTPPRENHFYRQHYHHAIYALMLMITLMIIAIGVVLYQVTNRPKPIFHAVQANNQTMLLTPFEEPNLLPDTILRWASKAASVAFTFDFVNYKKQIGFARPFFTEAGWQDYLGSIHDLISTIVQNQLFVSSVVVGTPVIANQGDLSGSYVWRVQIPFLVTYQSANTPSQRNYMVVLSIVRVETSTNPQGIGIDQFVMVGK